MKNLIEKPTEMPPSGSCSHSLHIPCVRSNLHTLKKLVSYLVMLVSVVGLNVISSTLTAVWGTLNSRACD